MSGEIIEDGYYINVLNYEFFALLRECEVLRSLLDNMFN